jgi:hypothetical protein
MVPMRVDEAVEAIMDRAKTLLVTAADGGLIDGVKIVRGDRSRPNAGVPAIWMVPDVATVDHTTHGLAELWNFPIILGAIVKDTDPDAGYLAANNLAAKAQQVLLGRKRRWELPFVEHVVAVRFDPTSPRTSNTKLSLFWADAVVNVRFRRLEPEEE